MPENRDKIPFYTRALSVPESINEEKRSVNVVMSTENPVMMYDWDRGYVDEILVMDGVIIREGDTAPLVDTHNYYSTKSILGSIINIKAKDGELSGDAVFSTTAEEEWTKVKEKHIRKLSIGYNVLSAIYVDKGQTLIYGGKSYTAGERDLKLSTKWELYEGSLVTIPADNDTKIRSKENKMPEEIKVPAQPAGETRSQVEIDAEKRSAADTAAKAERTRQSEIRSMCKDHNLGDDFVTGLLDNGTSIDESRKLVLEEIGKRSKIVPPKTPTSSVTVTVDGVDNLREACETSMCMRSGLPYDQKKGENVRKSVYNGIGLIGSARSFLAYHGERGIEAMSNEQVALKVLSGRSMAVTTDYVELLANVANKILQKSFVDARTTFEAWCSKGSLPDFKTADIPNLSLFSDLAEIAEGDAFVDGSFADVKEQAQLKTYGKSYVISRQAIINDDLGAFTNIGMLMGGAAKRLVNKLAYTKLIANAALSQDSKALFHVDHGNIAASGAAVGVATIGAGRAAMRKQKSNGAFVGNFSPAILIVHPDNETDAEAFLGSNFDPAKENGSTNNPFSNKLQLVSDGILDDNTISGYSTTAWYLAASPTEADTIKVFYLNGNETPTVRSEASRVAAALGVSFDVFFDAGVAAIGYQGLYKNAGA